MNENMIFEKFNNGLHRIGRLLMFLGIIVLVSVPFIVAVIYNTKVDSSGFVAGILNVGALYIPIAVVEFLVYSPMLGAGGSYISFITGNVTNMKIPCAMNARDIAGTEVGTPENEIISTISTATSAIVTTLVIVVGVILLVPLQPVLENPVVKPAFDYVVPALFGALGLKYFSKSLKIAVIPLAVMSLLCIFVPSMINQTGILMIPSGALALAIGYILFKKGKL
jgi:hypothetical protein